MSGKPGDSVVREGQTFAGDSLLSRFASFVKLPHTLFALPFALLGVLAAFFFKVIGAPYFPFAAMLAISVGLGFALGALRALPRLVGR